MSFTDRSVIFLRSIGRFVRAVEGLLIDNISAISPWLAPVIPAYMVYSSLSSILAFPGWVAFAGAGVVELLGLSAVNTTFSFWDYNDSRRKLDQRAPTIVAGITASFYLAVVLTVNVLLDPSPNLHKLAKALMSSLSICAAVILSLRAGHARRIESNYERRELLRQARQHMTQPTEAQVARNLAHDWRKLPNPERVEIASLSVPEIQERYPGLSLRAAQYWKVRSRNNGHGEGPGYDGED